MTKFTFNDYAQYAYDALLATEATTPEKSDLVEFLDAAEVTSSFITGFIMGKGVFTMTDLSDCLEEEDIPESEAFVNKYWDLIDK